MDEIITLDRQLLLALNGSDNTTVDAFFMAATHTTTWVPMFLFVVYAIWRNRGWRELLLVLLGTVVVVLMADRVSSGLCKPLFHRLRPSHEPALEGLIDLVNGYRGGLYGFISSHAANTFGVATFITLCLRHKPQHTEDQALSGTVANRLSAILRTLSKPTVSIALLFVWAVISSYSRIYLGVHYPGDIMAGMAWGIISAAITWRLIFIPLQRRLAAH